MCVLKKSNPGLIILDCHVFILKDQSNNEIMIGVMSGGILIYKNKMRMNTFPW